MGRKRLNIAGLDGQGLGRNMTGKSVMREPEKQVCRQASLNA